MGDNRRKLAIRSTFIRDLLSEFLSTFVFVLCVNGLTAQSLVTSGEKATALACQFGHGIGAMAGMFIGGGVTGAHMNPALTLGMATVGKLPWRKLPAYWIGQYLGAFTAATVVFVVYTEAVIATDTNLATIFATYPASFLSVGGAIFDQFVGTALLVGCASGITDFRNSRVSLAETAIYIGFLIMAIQISFAGNYICGSSMNPARDLSPRLLSYFVGSGIEVFSFQNWSWFWIPVLIPHIGGIVGALLYTIFIEVHWPH